MADVLSRRDFLKVVGAGIGAAVASPLLSACSPEEEQVKPEYHKISEGGSLNLKIGNEGTTSNVTISYRQQGEFPTWPLHVRIVNGEAKYIPFQNGEERVRIVGEILEPVLYRVCRNTSLSDEITVGVYREATTPISMTLSERIDLPEGDDVYGLPVVTVFADWMKDRNSEPPFEINARPPVESWENLDKFGKGIASGRLEHTEKGYTFTVDGFIFDSRAVETVQK